MFYTDLAHEIYENYFQKIPMNSTLADSHERWFALLAKLKFESASDEEFWLNYWTDHPCLTKPTEQDQKKLQSGNRPDGLGFGDEPLNLCDLALCTSLKALIENDYENLESTENLHQYQLLTKAELKRRGFETTLEDSFIVDINKKNRGQLISMTKARREGICPYCNSKEHVISYGDKWKCNKCNKYIRKA
jgi:hypothetical protein